MDKGNGIISTQTPTAINHLLTAALYFGVLSLHRGKVEVLGAVAARHGGRGTTAQTDQHRGATQYHELGAGRIVTLVDVLGTHVAKTAGDHDGFVISPDTVGRLGFKGSEVAREIGPAKFIVKRRRTDRPLGHDIQRRDNSARAAIAQLPGARLVWQLQMGNRETHQPDLGSRATPYGTLVTNFTTRAGTRTRKGRDCRRVIVGLHFHQQMNRLVVKSPDLIRDVWIEPPCPMACDDGGIIGIR